MKNSLNLSITNPCSENWNSFTATRDGAFCGTCSKVVVDFTTMSDDDIVDFFAKGTRTCGRFRPEQLTAYQVPTPRINTGVWLLKAGILSAFLVLAGKTTIAQVNTETKTVQQAATQKNPITSGQIIKGNVRANDDQAPLAGVNIYLKNSTIGTVTDEKGTFTFPKKLSVGDTLVFSFIGYETKQYVVQNDNVDVDMTIDIGLVFDEIVIMGDVATETIYDDQTSALRRLIGRVKSIF